MKMLLVIILTSFVSSCAYNEIVISASGNAKVDCKASVEKPVKVKSKVPVSIIP